LALQVQEALRRDPHAGDLYVFRGARGDLIRAYFAQVESEGFPMVCQ
jgi:transposase